MSTDWSDELSRLTNLYLEEVIKPILPNSRISSAGAMYAADKMPERFDLRLSTSEMFHNSIYEVNRHKDYLHFTRLSSIERILRERIILASSAQYFSDIDEIQYGLTRISSAQTHAIEKAKKATYILSMAEDNEHAVNDHFMWNLYGDLGKGGFLRFEVPIVSYPFSFGKVRYGLDELGHFSELDHRILQFKAEHNLTAKDIEIVLLHIAACHKSRRFESEKEVRLIYSKDYEYFGGLPDMSKRAFIGSDGVTREALEIPIKVLSQGESLVESPATLLRLKEIVLGYGVPDDALHQTIKLLMTILPANPQVRIQRLNKELELIRLY